MKKSLVTLALSVLFSTGAYAADNAMTTATHQGSALTTSTSSAMSLNNETDRISYALGYDIGHSFKNQKVQLNINAMNEGVKNGFTDSKSLMTPQEIQTTLLNFQKQLLSQRQAQLAKIGDKNLQDGEAFLAANKTKPGVVTLANGLQYKIITEGQGKSPNDKDIVTVNYQGSLINGQVFDSTYVTNGKPLTVPVARVIPGWRQALKMMKPGATWEVYIPANLAYGNTAVGPIAPNQTLIFKIQLISATPMTAASEATALNNANQAHR